MRCCATRRAVDRPPWRDRVRWKQSSSRTLNDVALFCKTQKHPESTLIMRQLFNMLKLLRLLVGPQTPDQQAKLYRNTCHCTSLQSFWSPQKRGYSRWSVKGEAPKRLDVACGERLMKVWWAINKKVCQSKNDVDFLNTPKRTGGPLLCSTDPHHSSWQARLFKWPTFQTLAKGKKPVFVQIRLKESP